MKKREKPLSERQVSILRYIWSYLQENTRPPTIREIGSATDISSTSVVNYNLTKLTERGLLEREAEVSRGLRLTEKAMHEIGQVTEAVAAVVENVMETAVRMVRVPLLGNIVAGEPIEVGNNDFSTYDEDDALELSATMLPMGKADELFALRVSGESMIDAMVNDGDIVVMKQQQMAKNGDMVAVWLNSSDTTTLKYFFHEGNRVRLQPANPTMDPIFVDPNDVRVQGKVMMVLRNTA
ncbi:MAG: transcriptional repressor LexA [Anaerolineales bacterium]|nr:transcriptional repressor LexA [Anaerolineales bacterium]MCB8966028.1 repressor LexA [Ardenticatenaceae bacterium]